MKIWPPCKEQWFYHQNTISITQVWYLDFKLVSILFQMEEERNKFSAERTKQIRSLQERQEKEIEKFDEESEQLGLDSAKVAEASCDGSFDDEVSLRGSMISLTPSSSSSSFSSQAYNM